MDVHGFRFWAFEFGAVFQGRGASGVPLLSRVVATRADTRLPRLLFNPLCRLSGGLQAAVKGKPRRAAHSPSSKIDASIRRPPRANERAQGGQRGSRRALSDDRAEPRRRRSEALSTKRAI